MSWRVLLVVLGVLASRSASADPGRFELGVEMSGALPVGDIKRGHAMSDRISLAGLVGGHAAYRYSERGSIGAFGEYGVGNSDETRCLACGYTLESHSRLIRFGIETTRRYDKTVLGIAAGYELLFVTYTWLDQMNAYRWRGFELMRPSAGFVAYESRSIVVVPYAALSFALFDTESRNGMEHWIANETSDSGTPGMALHAWLMVGARVSFAP